MSLQAINVTKEFGTPATQVIKGINFTIEIGEFVALVGKSGSGKSTMLYILSSLDDPTKGSILLDDQDVAKMESKTLHEFRNRRMGFVFQFHYLLAEITVLENVLMPAVKAKEEQKRKELAISLLTEFGLGDKLNRFPRQLSGGEQQRVAIARALVMEPDYVFADEPTGSLDSVNGDIVMRILQDVNVKKKTTVVLVTHDQEFAGLAKRKITLVDGLVSSDEKTMMKKERRHEVKH